jgi:hypothetical protein
MLKYNSAPPAHKIEHSPREPDRTPAMVCQCCGDTMRHSRTIPKLGVLPELLVFVCPSCREVGARQFKKVGLKAANEL